MASSSGNSSGSSAQLQNSGSGDDQRKRKRMESNRESARRSRMRKQQRLEDLTAQISQLRKENHQILTSITVTTQNYLRVESENSVIRAQMVELSQRLESLNEILSYMNTINGVFESDHHDLEAISGGFVDNPWNLMYLNQPIIASADMFQY